MFVLHLIVSSFVILLLLQESYSLNFKNNACPHLSLYPFAAISGKCYQNPNVASTTPNMITQNGYTVKSYQVVTKDNYILTLFRISDTNGSPQGKVPIFLQHGIGSDSSAWTHIGNRSLGFRLVEKGYDVWLGNFRGNSYSPNRTADAKGPYFNYTLDDLAKYDIDSSLETVAKETGMGGKIIYVGHSLGSTVLLMYASENPEKVSKLLSNIFLLSPIVYFDVKLYVKPILGLAPVVLPILNNVGISSLPPNTDIFHTFARYYCSLFPYICRGIINLVFGISHQFAADDLLVFATSFGTKTDVKEFIQYGQMYKSGKFQKYDHGLQNQKVYGSPSPPKYNLGNVTVPCFMFHGENENLITKTSVEKVLSELGSQVKSAQIAPVGDKESSHQYNHIDFIFAENLEEFYKTLLPLIDKQSTNQ